MTPSQAAQWLGFFQRRPVFLPDREDLSQRWLSLVQTYNVKGFRCHDVRLVAAMQSYGISRLLTFNVHHFGDMPITVMDPNTF